MDDMPRKRDPQEQKWAWVLTGSGHFFDECLEIMRTLDGYDVFLSLAAEEVLRMYKHRGKIFPDGVTVFRDTTASAAPVGQFYKGYYHSLVMAPVSSNTVAKCVYGISDNLATNVFAQAGKCRVPAIVFACDTAPELETKAPAGMVKVYPRRIDLENVAKLRDFESTAVVESMADLRRAIAERREWLSASSS
jgi:flavoprotein